MKTKNQKIINKLLFALRTLSFCVELRTNYEEQVTFYVSHTREIL